MGSGVSFNAWGVFWGDSWGTSWGPLHEVDELRPPRAHPNLKLQRIREGYVLLSGVSASGQAGQITARGAVHVPVVVEEVGAAVTIAGAVAYGRTGVLVATGSSVAALCGVQVDSVTGACTVSGHAAASLGAVAGTTGAGVVAADGGCCATLEWSEEAESFSGDLGGRGIRNPSDEELALLAIQLVS